MATEMRILVCHLTFSYIIMSINEYFFKAGKTGDGMSELL